MGHKCYETLLISFVVVGLSVLAKETKVRAESRQQPKSAEKITSPQTRPRENTTFALEGTDLLKLPVSKNIREEQRQQIIRYFTEQIAATPAKRDSRWQTNFSSLDAYKASVQGHRNNLRAMLGLIEPKLGTPTIKVLREERNLRVEDVTIPIYSGFSARALLFLPHSSVPAAGVIAIPPANESREEFAGIAEGMTPAKWLKTLLTQNVAVAVPVMTERRDDYPYASRRVTKTAGGFCGAQALLWVALW